MPTQKKIRSDAKLHELERRLTAVEREELGRIAAHGSLDGLRRFAEAHGVPIGSGTASRTAARLREAGERLLRRNQAIGAVREAAARAGTTLTAAAVEQAAIAVGDVIDASADPQSEEGRKLLIAALPALTGARQSEIAADRVRASREALALAERRLAVMEQRMKQAKAVVESARLTPEEQRARLREIFGK